MRDAVSNRKNTKFCMGQEKKYYNDAIWKPFILKNVFQIQNIDRTIDVRGSTFFASNRKPNFMSPERSFMPACCQTKQCDEKCEIDSFAECPRASYIVFEDTK